MTTTTRRRSTTPALAFAAAFGLGFAASASAGTGADVTVPLESSPTIIDNAYTDTYDPAVGPYGGSNVGPAPTITTGTVVPSFSAPTGLPSTGEYKLDSQTATLSGDLRCDKLLLANHSTLTISGDVTIVVTEEFKVENHSKIVLGADATLTLYCLKDATVQDHAEVNPDTTRPADLTVYKLGTKEFILQNDAMMVGQVYASDTFLQVENGADFYGTLDAMSMYLKNNAGAHFCDPAGAPAPTTVAPLYD